MIDCGVILGTRDACAKLQVVIADIIKMISLQGGCSGGDP